MSVAHSPIDHLSQAAAASSAQFGSDADISLSLDSLNLNQHSELAVSQEEATYNGHYLQDYGTVTEPETPRTGKRSSGTPTRTVAMIKNHALHNRLDIEHRILEAGFEVRLCAILLSL
jgi:hypothetical protein